MDFQNSVNKTISGDKTKRGEGCKELHLESSKCLTRIKQAYFREKDEWLKSEIRGYLLESKKLLESIE